LPKESLLGRIVVISNPNIAQLQLKGGFFNTFDDFKTKIASFLSDFNMRRDYRILQQKCGPNAFLFTGTLVATGTPQGTSDNPSGTIDEEAYISLVSRWNWIFEKSDTSPFLFSPSTYDVAFRPDFIPSLELERRILYQRFVDYFGPLNWKFGFGPYTLASIFTPSLDPPDQLLAQKSLDLQVKSSITAQIKSETEDFIKTKLVGDAASMEGPMGSSSERRLVLVSAMPFWPEWNATCVDAELEGGLMETDYVRTGSLSQKTSEDLLKTLNPLAIVSLATQAPRCTLVHKQTNTSQIMAVSYSDTSNNRFLNKIPSAIAKLGRSRRPGVLVLEARNASMISSSGTSSLLSSYDLQQPANTSFELNTIFFDTTTYMDMKGPYIWLVFLSVLGLMISVEAGSGSSSEFFATSYLVETCIAIAKFIWVSLILIIRRLYSACSKTPLKSCLLIDLESGVDSLRPFDQPPSRILRILALRFQITLEIMLICSTIVVPWCIFVMFHWM
jgi:hypothetical protein